MWIQLRTYPKGALVIHGGVGVSKLCNQHAFEPALQDGRDSEPLQRELGNSTESDQVHSTSRHEMPDALLPASSSL